MYAVKLLHDQAFNTHQGLLKLSFICAWQGTLIVLLLSIAPLHFMLRISLERKGMPTRPFTTKKPQYTTKCMYA